MHIENVGEYLKKNGIKPSVQRMKIFQYLLDHHTHPTVDDIFQNLSPEMPTLSKTTVYNPSISAYLAILKNHFILNF